MALKVAFISDAGALRPTLLAIWSALTHASGALEINFVGLGLSEDDWQQIASVIAGFPSATLNRIEFDDSLLLQAHTTADHISRATFARLFLHRLVRGRVLYLDGDILVTGDLCRIADLDLAGGRVAVVHDFTTMKLSARQRSSWLRRKSAARKLVRFDAYAPPERYFNAGVLFMDADAICADPDLCQQLEDVEAAATYRMADQDHLNWIFAEEALFLGPEWNCSWGRLGLQRRFMRRCGIQTDPGARSDTPVILHFHGPKKPWKDLPLYKLGRLWRGTLIYRQARRRFNAAYPDLAF